MKAIFAAALVLVTAFASAQDSKRIDAIWEAANDRFTRQLDLWFEDGEFPIAIQLLKLQADLYPADYEIVTNLGWMLENVEEYSAAEEVYVGYRKGNPNNPDAILPEAEYWFRKKKYETVLALTTQVSDKAHPNAFRIRAHSFERLTKLKESQQVWKRYLKLAPNDSAAKMNLARVERKIGERNAG